MTGSQTKCPWRPGPPGAVTGGTLCPRQGRAHATGWSRAEVVGPRETHVTPCPMPPPGHPSTKTDRGPPYGLDVSTRDRSPPSPRRGQGVGTRGGMGWEGDVGDTVQQSPAFGDRRRLRSLFPAERPCRLPGSPFRSRRPDCQRDSASCLTQTSSSFFSPKGEKPGGASRGAWTGSRRHSGSQEGQGHPQKLQNKVGAPGDRPNNSPAALGCQRGRTPHRAWRQRGMLGGRPARICVKFRESRTAGAAAASPPAESGCTRTGSRRVLFSLPRDAVPFDSRLMNTPPAETVAQAALILPGHPTGEQNAVRSPPRNRSNTGLPVAPWPSFSSLLPPDNPPGPEPASPFPRAGGQGRAWMSTREPSWQPGARAGRTGPCNWAGSHPSAPGTAPAAPGRPAGTSLPPSAKPRGVTTSLCRGGGRWRALQMARWPAFTTPASQPRSLHLRQQPRPGGLALGLASSFSGS